MIKAEDQMRHASMTAEEWYKDSCPPHKQEDLKKDPTIIAAKIIAAGLDEIAMSNRMIAEALNRTTTDANHFGES